MLRRPCKLVPVVVLAFALRAPAETDAQPFTLGRFVPHNCFLFMHGVHNPESAFIYEHWGRVLEEVKKSGIEREFKKLFTGNMPVDARAEFARAWDDAIELIKGVRWGDLAAREMVIAERLGGVAPDVFVLFRSAPESVAPNVEGLRAILDALAQFSERVAVTETTRNGVPVLRLGTPDFPWALFLFRQQDVVGVVLGERALDDVLSLMAGRDGVTAIVDSPRYKQAVAELPTPEDSVVFLDFHQLFGDLSAMCRTVLHCKPVNRPGRAAPPDTRVVFKLLDQLNFLDYLMEVYNTDGLRQTANTTLRICPDAKDKPLCRMLTSRKPFARFDRFVPKDAGGFSVSTLIDFQVLYHVILDFIREEIPGGPAALDGWSALQEEHDFNLDDDVFSWLSGEMVSVSMAPAVQGPFASPDFVLFARVKNDELAEVKVNAGIDRLAAFARDFEQIVVIADEAEVQAEGFRSLTHAMLAMQGIKLIVGVTDGHLVIGSSASAINACLATAAGTAPSIVENERFRREGLAVNGPVCYASFTDLRNSGQELSTALFMVGMVGQFVPEEPETRPIKAMFNILGRLSPAIAKIDFFNSSAMTCTFDGQAWRMQQVINYKPAPPPPAATTVRAPATAR